MKHLKQVYESKTKIRLRKKMGGKMTTKSSSSGLGQVGVNLGQVRSGSGRGETFETGV